MMDRALLSVALREHRKELEREEASDLRDLQDLNGRSAGSSSTVKRSRKQKHERTMSTSLKPKQLQQQVTGNMSTQDGVVAAPKKRKKISRACNNCQVAHLTCSTSRPCVRCIKRGLQDSCQDGARKKAKYLLDVEDDRRSGLALLRAALISSIAGWVEKLRPFGESGSVRTAMAAKVLIHSFVCSIVQSSMREKHILPTSSHQIVSLAMHIGRKTGQAAHTPYSCYSCRLLSLTIGQRGRRHQGRLIEL